MFDDPPAPAARVEFGLDTCAPARRLDVQNESSKPFVACIVRFRKLYRIWAPGGFATPVAGARPEPLPWGESESDYGCISVCSA